MELFSFRWMETVAITAAGVFFGWIGYRLFVFAVEKGWSRFESRSRAAQFCLSGMLPAGLLLVLGPLFVGGSLYLGVVNRPETTGIKMEDLTALAQSLAASHAGRGSHAGATNNPAPPQGAQLNSLSELLPELQTMLRELTEE